ncbi:MAG: MarR family transcriptional regulator [Pseudolabrys sp.]|nr:MarR family transcriptional regulator [Pseudolabrys sp.]
MQAKMRRIRRRDVVKEAVAQPPEVKLGWLGGTIGFNLRIAQEASVRAYLRSVADTGTLAWRFAILALIDLNPGLTQVALARAVSRDTSSLTSVLDDMCNRGLVTRVRPDHDRRSYALRITPQGVKAMNELKANVRNHERELDRLFTGEQRSLLIEMLKQIASELTLND